MVGQFRGRYCIADGPVSVLVVEMVDWCGCVPHAGLAVVGRFWECGMDSLTWTGLKMCVIRMSIVQGLSFCKDLFQSQSVY